MEAVYRSFTGEKHKSISAGITAMEKENVFLPRILNSTLYKIRSGPGPEDVGCGDCLECLVQWKHETAHVADILPPALPGPVLHAHPVAIPFRLEPCDRGSGLCQGERVAAAALFDGHAAACLFVEGLHAGQNGVRVCHGPACRAAQALCASRLTQ